MKANEIAFIGTSALLTALMMSACGGGKDQGCVTLDPTRNSNLPSCTAPTPPTTSGAATTGPSIFPAEVNAGDCTTNIPFVVAGGTAPFTILTSDNLGVPVSASQPYGADSFFMASVRNPLGPFPYKATLTVLDSQSRTAVAHLTVDYQRTCPANALLQTNPSSANAHPTEMLTFQITGSASPYTVASNNAAIATAMINPGGTSLNVSAVAAGTALITVKGTDNQQSNIVFTVLPP